MSNDYQEEEEDEEEEQEEEEEEEEEEVCVGMANQMPQMGFPKLDVPYWGLYNKGIVFIIRESCLFGGPL